MSLISATPAASEMSMLQTTINSLDNRISQASEKADKAEDEFVSTVKQSMAAKAEEINQLQNRIAQLEKQKVEAESAHKCIKTKHKEHLILYKKNVADMKEMVSAMRTLSAELSKKVINLNGANDTLNAQINALKSENATLLSQVNAAADYYLYNRNYDHGNNIK